jgi:hypothetical protein
VCVIVCVITETTKGAVLSSWERKGKLIKKWNQPCSWR